MYKEEFALPPLMFNSRGDLRRVGFEFEFGGVGIQKSAEIVARIFGGEIRQQNRFHSKVENTSVGAFSIESDSSMLKQRKYEKLMRSLGLDPKENEWGEKIESIIESVTSDLVPFEIVTPPIPLDKMECVEELREELRRAGARGTHAHVFSAFGMQFNPEMPSLTCETMLSYLRAFFLLYDWLKTNSDVPIARRVLPYIDAFPEEYVELVLDEQYHPTQEEFMRDYLEQNPTRNRPLDWLPLFAFIDKDLVFSYDVERELIKPRPTLHYRLPSSLIDDPNWTIKGEWNKWAAVERLAAQPALIRELSREWRDVHGPLQLRSESRWLKRSNEFLGAPGPESAHRVL